MKLGEILSSLRNHPLKWDSRGHSELERLFGFDLSPHGFEDAFECRNSDFNQISFSTFDVFLRSTKAPYDYDDLEDLIDEYLRIQQNLVEDWSDTLGKPLFNDGQANRNFPEDQEAEFLALWPIQNARLMLLVRHDDKELPVALCLRVTKTQ